MQQILLKGNFVSHLTTVKSTCGDIVTIGELSNRKDYNVLVNNQYSAITANIYRYLLPLLTTGQIVDHYCYWFLELSFSRISESTTGYTFTLVWDILLPLA